MDLAINAVRVVQGALRAMTSMVYARFPRTRVLFGSLGSGEEPNYAVIIGDGRGSNLLMSCISWVVNGFTQMRPMVLRLEDEDELAAEKIFRHPAVRLFRRPVFDVDRGFSPFTWMTLIAGLLVSFICDGNAYAFKIRGAGGFGKPVQLWYVPHWMIEPIWNRDDPTVFIAYYDYCPDGVNHYPVRVEDVIHLRDGLDPDNTRKGLSKVKTLLREIMTDEQAAAWTATLLRNHAVPGLVLSPKESLDDADDGEEVERRLTAKFTGAGRGRPIVMLDPTDVTPYGFSPEQMKLGDIRDIPEERVSTAVGIPAAVIGFGAGLQSTKVGATMAELVDLAWQNGVLPRARIIAALLTEQLLSEFESDAAEGTEFAFDTSAVPIMADFHLKLAQRHDLLVRSGIETRGTAARAQGIKRGPRDDVYILNAGAVEVDATKTLEQSNTLAEEKAKRLAPPAPVPALGPGATQPTASTQSSTQSEGAGTQSGLSGKGLSDRELEVADMVAEGLSNKQISGRLNLSERTVERHVSSALTKTGTGSRTELAAAVAKAA
jgi:HK97 family phage portal protein